MSAPRPLGSTYRLQLAGLGFAGARRLVGYLDDVGIETLYLSPILRAVPGSTHGYDVVDPTSLDPSLGSLEEFEALLEELDAHHMRVLLDIVPNHMACDAGNEWWWDTLRHGLSSPYAATFDIDWALLANRVLIPSLSAPLADLVESATWELGPQGPLISVDAKTYPLASEPTASETAQGILERQNYRLAYWRLSAHERNYRRFFDIDGLVGIQVERDEVFVRTHQFIAQISDDERVAGWRVDHVDGLRFPHQYLGRLSELQLPERKSSPVILVEKIVAEDERIPESWPVAGTTGYEFMSHASGLLVDPVGYLAIATLGEQLGGSVVFSELGLAAKREVIASSFPGELSRLGELARDLLDQSHPGHDLATHDIALAVEELSVRLDVYRTYLFSESLSRNDRARLAGAAHLTLNSLLGETRRAANLLWESMVDDRYRDSEFILRWQQLTTAVMAKGVEDTATYRYCGLLSHADVGSDPGHATRTVEDFHAFSLGRVQHPNTLNATSTHDSKRSEDARARLCALSEFSDEWMSLVATWHQRYLTFDIALEDELRIYQGWLCLWDGTDTPALTHSDRRIAEYAVKSSREAKRRTSWAHSDARYEERLGEFVAQLGDDRRFITEMNDLLVQLGPAAVANSLSLLLLKCLSPGVPDFYQGTEYFTHTLTDPDNREPVDFERRRSQIRNSTDLFAARSELLSFDLDTLKLSLTRALLGLRRQHRNLFASGAYVPVEAIGPRAKHVVAFARHLEGRWVLACAPRVSARLAPSGHYALAGVWDGTALKIPPGAPSKYVDLFSGAAIEARDDLVSVAQCLASLPISVLISDPD